MQHFVSVLVFDESLTWQCSHNGKVLGIRRIIVVVGHNPYTRFNTTTFIYHCTPQLVLY